MARNRRTFCEADNLEQKPDRLLKIVDGAIFSAIACAPLVMGGRHAWGHLALVAIIMVGTTCWLVRQFQPDQGEILGEEEEGAEAVVQLMCWNCKDSLASLVGEEG